MKYIPSRLPEIDVVEIVNLRGIDTDGVATYMQNSAEAEFIKLSDESAKLIAELWRNLPESGQMRCHNPPFGLRFYVDKISLLQASICWECNNIFGDEKGAGIHYQFDGESEASQKLLSICKSHFLSDDKIIETERTILRELTIDDADFMLDLLNQPSFIKYIGDRNVRTIEESREFIETRYRASYAQHGFGLYAVELKETGEVIGINGFVKRDYLLDADIGFAFLPQFENKGFAFESAEAVMKYGREILNLKKILAITTQDNETSGRLLAKLGFAFEGLVKLPHDQQMLKLYTSE